MRFFDKDFKVAKDSELTVNNNDNVSFFTFLIGPWSMPKDAGVDFYTLLLY